MLWSHLTLLVQTWRKRIRIYRHNALGFRWLVRWRSVLCPDAGSLAL